MERNNPAYIQSNISGVLHTNAGDLLPDLSTVTGADMSFGPWLNCLTDKNNIW